MLMELAEIRYRADMSSDPRWEMRYRIALQYDLPNPVDLDKVDAILNNLLVLPEEIAKEVAPKTWRDLPPLL